MSTHNIHRHTETYTSTHAYTQHTHTQTHTNTHVHSTYADTQTHISTHNIHKHTHTDIHKHTQAYAHIRKHACTHANTHPQLETPSCLRLLGTHTKGPGDPQEHQGCGWVVIWAPFSETAGSEQSPWEGRAPGVPPPGDEGTALPPKITQSPQSSSDLSPKPS